MILLDFYKSELTNWVLSLGYPKFRANQLYDVLLSGKDVNSKTNLPKDMLEHISSLVVMQPVKIEKLQESKKEHNVKFLYKLVDGHLIEGMLMQYKFGCTLCVSTQVGCKMNCAFCASGLNGWVRNLSAGEILGQIVAVNAWLGGNATTRKITNVVLMGMGEPLDNYDNVVKFLRQATKESFNFSCRNISLSTCGIVPKIEKFADEGLPVTLCISLHAPNDRIRTSIMPIARNYNIHSILEAAQYYYTMTNRRIIIEYTVIDGVNDSFDNAKELSQLLGTLPCHVNVIRLNEVKERGLKAPTQNKCQEFVNTLNRFGISATTRRTIGDDIDGACGQLRNKVATNLPQGKKINQDDKPREKNKSKDAHNRNRNDLDKSKHFAKTTKSNTISKRGSKIESKSNKNTKQRLHSNHR